MLSFLSSDQPFSKLSSVFLSVLLTAWTPFLSSFDKADFLQLGLFYASIFGLIKSSYNKQNYFLDFWGCASIFAALCSLVLRILSWEDSLNRELLFELIDLTITVGLYATAGMVNKSNKQLRVLDFGKRLQANQPAVEKTKTKIDLLIMNSYSVVFFLKMLAASFILPKRTSLDISTTAIWDLYIAISSTISHKPVSQSCFLRITFYKVLWNDKFFSGSFQTALIIESCFKIRKISEAFLLRNKLCFNAIIKFLSLLAFLLFLVFHGFNDKQAERTILFLAFFSLFSAAYSYRTLYRQTEKKERLSILLNSFTFFLKTFSAEATCFVFLCLALFLEAGFAYVKLALSVFLLGCIGKYIYINWRFRGYGLKINAKEVVNSLGKELAAQEIGIEKIERALRISNCLLIFSGLIFVGILAGGLGFPSLLSNDTPTVHLCLLISLVNALMIPPLLLYLHRPFTYENWQVGCYIGGWALSIACSFHFLIIAEDFFFIFIPLLQLGFVTFLKLRENQWSLSPDLDEYINLILILSGIYSIKQCFSTSLAFPPTMATYLIINYFFFWASATPKGTIILSIKCVFFFIFAFCFAKRASLASELLRALLKSFTAVFSADWVVLCFRLLKAFWASGSQFHRVEDNAIGFKLFLKQIGLIEKRVTFQKFLETSVWVLFLLGFSWMPDGAFHELKISNILFTSLITLVAISCLNFPVRISNWEVIGLFEIGLMLYEERDTRLKVLLDEDRDNPIDHPESREANAVLPNSASRQTLVNWLEADEIVKNMNTEFRLALKELYKLRECLPKNISQALDGKFTSKQVCAFLLQLGSEEKNEVFKFLSEFQKKRKKKCELLQDREKELEIVATRKSSALGSGPTYKEFVISSFGQGEIEGYNTMPKSLEDYPDSPFKFSHIQRIMNKVNEKYTDDKFKPNDRSIGHGLIKKIGYQGKTINWKRPPEAARLFYNGFFPQTARQGALGDCYLLGALSLLTEESAQRIFCHSDVNGGGCGAYIVRFSILGEDLFVIVDDLFPVDEKGDWLFARCEDKMDLWPQVAEKAYAKLYGSYEAIDEGKLSFALSELTGGHPEELRLEQFISAPDSLWRLLKEFHSLGYLVGSGTPSVSKAAGAVQKNGLIKGHAYSIQDVRELMGHRLVKLRNPHGGIGILWKGDWSDESDKWTEELLEQLGRNANLDGTFWMSFDDFLMEFKSLYVCRLFESVKWNSYPKIRGELTTARNPASNPSLKFDFLSAPQYKITIQEKTTIFVSLRIRMNLPYPLDASDDLCNGRTFKGPIPIFFLVTKGDDGKAKSTKNVIGSSGPPTNLKMISKEITLESDTYPECFNLVLGTLACDVERKEEYELLINSVTEIDISDLSYALL